LSVDLTYAVARLKALEAEMPDGQWFLRLAGTDGKSLLEMIRERYPHFREIEALHLYEDAIEAEKRERLDLIGSIVRDGRTVEFIRSGYDFDDMVQAWKARMLGRQPFLASFGLLSPGEIAGVLESGDPVGLPPYMKRLHGMLLEASKDGDPAAVQYAGEKARWDHLRSIAPGAEARRWVALRIDSANIRIFLSLEWSDIRKNVPVEIWIEGGTLEASRLEQLRGDPAGDLFSFLAWTDWRSLAGEGFTGEMDRGAADHLIRKTLLDLIGRGRYRYFDIMPLLYHIELLDRNAELLRTVVTGRINRLPEKMVAGSVERALN